MTKKMVKRTDANNEILYFYTHSDVVDVGEGNNTTSLTNALNNKANTSDVQALSDDALRKSSQSLSNQEKEQVHNNIGTESFVDDRAVRYDDAQVLGSEEKTQALTNLGLNGVDDEPTPGSENLVKSGGVANEIAVAKLKDGDIVSSFNPKSGYYTYDEGTNKKKFLSTDNVKYVEIPLNASVNSVTLYGFTYTPSPDASITYTRVIFFDDEDNLLTKQDSITDATNNALTINVPTGATQCYVDVPAVHVNDLVLQINKEYLFYDSKPIFGSNNLVKSGAIAKYPSLSSVKSNNIRNGSLLNIYNDKYVTTECLYFGSMKNMRLFIGRPNAEGCEYRVGWALTSSADDIGTIEIINNWQGRIAKTTDPTKNEVFDFSDKPTGIGVAFAIGEFNTSTDEQQTLRTSDFDGYDVGLVMLDVIDGRIKPFESKVYGNDVGRKVNNGSQLNPHNEWVVTIQGNETLAIPVVAGHKYKLFIDKEPASGFHNYWRFITYTTESPSTLSSNIVRNQINSWTSYQTLDDAIVAGSTEKGLSIQLTELTEAGAAQDAEHCVALRETDFTKENLRLVDITDCLQEQVDENTNHLTDVDNYNGKSKASQLAITGLNIGLYNYVYGQYINKDGSYKKHINVLQEPNASLIRYTEIPVSTIKDRIILRNFKYTPSPGSLSTYTTIIFFDAQDNWLGSADTLVKGEISMSKPEGATQCYVNYPSAYADSIIIQTQEDTAQNAPVVIHNKDRAIMLTASCRFRKTSNASKDFQMLIVTDSHGDTKSVVNAINATNGFDKIDALIHCGDCIANVMGLDENVNALWKNIMRAGKPCYFVVGNHEKGTYPFIYGNPLDSSIYNAFIKPMVDNGWLVTGEYTENKCYWYHDFSVQKIRLIALDEYEAPYILDNTYWEAITYNSALTEYDITFPSDGFSQGDEINVKGYTDYSFRAKQAIPAVSYSNNTPPSYKYRRGYRWISQTQAEWFLDKLATTPSDYQVIVACHNPYSNKADVDQTKMFSQKNNWTDGGPYLQNYMTNDFIADAINAFQTKANFSTTCSSNYPTDMPSYNVSKNFASVVGTFHSLVGGHVHEDCVWKHQDYAQWQVAPICSNTIQFSQSRDADIRRSSVEVSTDNDVDSLTVVSFGSGRIGLVKIGVNVTEDGNKRDYEVIDISI